MKKLERDRRKAHRRGLIKGMDLASGDLEPIRRRKMMIQQRRTQAQIASVQIALDENLAQLKRLRESGEMSRQLKEYSTDLASAGRN